jgi:hypothetical protein
MSSNNPRSQWAQSWWCSGQAFGAGLFVVVVQPVFESVLRPYLAQHVPSLDAQKVIKAGASGLHTVAASPDELQLLREACSM